MSEQHFDPAENEEIPESIAARRLAHTGAGGDDAPPPIPEGPKTAKSVLENIWYHYKFHILATLFIVLSLAILIPQCMMTSTDYDLSILYAGPSLEYRDQKTNAEIREAFSTLLSDYGEGGTTKDDLFLRALLVMTDEQYKAETEKNENVINPTFLQEQRRLFRDDVATGKTVICLLDPTLAAELMEEGWLLPLDALFGESDAAAHAALTGEKDGKTVTYGVKLCETDFGKYFDGVNALPRDTVLCMRRMGAMAPKEDSEEIYAAANHALRRLFSFTIPEDERDLYE